MKNVMRAKFFAGTAILLCMSVVSACEREMAAAPPGADGPVTAEGQPEAGANSEVVSEIEDATSAVVGAINAELTGTTQGFVEAISMNTMYEVAAAEIALDRSKRPAVLDFADSLLEESAQTQNELDEAVISSNIPVEAVTEIDSRHQGMLDNLTGASDEDFEERFLEQQVNAHNEALELTESYAESGRSPPLREFAADTAPSLQQRLARAEALSEQLAEEQEG